MKVYLFALTEVLNTQISTQQRNVVRLCRLVNLLLFFVVVVLPHQF